MEPRYKSEPSKEEKEQPDNRPTKQLSFKFELGGANSLHQFYHP